MKLSASVMRKYLSPTLGALRSTLKHTLAAELVRTVKRHYRKKKPDTTQASKPAPPPPTFNPKYTWFGPNDSCEGSDIALVVAFSGRHEVLKLVVKEAFAAKRVKLQIAVVLACSSSEDEAFAKTLQAEYGRIGVVVCDNQPLGNKWHLAVEATRAFKPKSIMITGSDDVVSVDYLKSCFETAQQDSLDLLGMIGPRIWYILDAREDLEAPRLWRVRYRDESHMMPLGAGRMYKASYLDSINWEIFDRKLSKLLDDKGYYDVLERQRAIYTPCDDDGMILSVKGSWTALNPLERILAAPSIEAVEITGAEREERLSKIDHRLGQK